MTLIGGPTGNHLLEHVREDTKARYSREISSVRLDSGHRIIGRAETMPRVFFPVNCVISRTYTTSSGHSAQMGMIGFEGVAGLSVFLGSEVAAYDAVVHIAGEAVVMKVGAAQAIFHEDSGFQRAVLRYIRAMIRQLSQVAVCNRLHSTEQRLSRWLLLNSMRARTNILPLTHEAIGQLVGARRESITAALGHLQRSSAIQCTRGTIEITNASCLEASACECYRVIRAEFEDCCRH